MTTIMVREASTDEAIWPLLGELRILTERLERAVEALVPQINEGEGGEKTE